MLEILAEYDQMLNYEPVVICSMSSKSGIYPNQRVKYKDINAQNLSRDWIFDAISMLNIGNLKTIGNWIGQHDDKWNNTQEVWHSLCLCILSNSSYTLYFEKNDPDTVWYWKADEIEVVTLKSKDI